MTDASAGDGSPRRKTAESVELGMLLAVVGGFLEHLHLHHPGRSVRECPDREPGPIRAGTLGTSLAQRVGVPAAADTFAAGVAVPETLRRLVIERLLRRPVRAAIVLGMIVLVAVGAVPASVPNAFVTTAVAFVWAIQTSTFRTLVDTAFNTTMNTGNLRTMSQAMFLGLADHDTTACGRAKRFGLVISSFSSAR